MTDLLDYARQELQKSGKSHIEVETNHYSETGTYWLDADRNRLRQIFIILIDDAIKYNDKGFMVFGYFARRKNIIDFFVDDTRYTNTNRRNDDDLSIARGLLKKTGSQLIEQRQFFVGSSFSFAVRGFTKLVENENLNPTCEE